MKTLEQLTKQLDDEIKHLETDPQEVALSKLLIFVDKDIAGQVSDKEADDFFKTL